MNKKTNVTDVDQLSCMLLIYLSGKLIKVKCVLGIRKTFLAAGTH